MLTDGEFGVGPWAGGRWCSTHNHYHGPLFVCEHYSKELAAAILAEEDQFRAHMADPSISDEDKFKYLKKIGVVEEYKGGKLLP